MDNNKIIQFASPLRMVEGRYGYMFFNQFDAYIGRSVENYGEYCEHEIDLFRQLLRQTDTVWEIGANTGSQSVALSKIVISGTYIGFEPQIELYKILVCNLTTNGCENAIPYSLALGNRSGYIDLPPIDYQQPFNFGSVSLAHQGNEGKGVQVEIRRIDDLAHLPLPHLIKLDVEGMEYDVLSGGSNLISQYKPVIYLENDRLDKSQALIELLWSLEYEAYWHISPYYNNKNFFNNQNNMFNNTASFNMLCFHTSKNITVNGLIKVTDSSLHPVRS